MADKDIELVSVVGQGGLLVQAGWDEAVGITANASEGRWTFGGTVWLTADEADRLAHALRHMADRAREKLAKHQEPKMTDAEATWAEMAVKKAVEGVGGFAYEMRQKGVHVGLGFGGSPGRCVTCAEPWPCSQMDMDAAEAMNHIGRAVEEAMGESINSDPNGPPMPWLPLSVRYAAAEAAARVVVEWRARESAAPDSGSGGNDE